jgi:hypothetical protein
MNTNPDGDVELGGIALECIQWLEKKEKPMFDKCRTLILKDANENYSRTGVIFNSFDLLREIIEYTQKKQSTEIAHERIINYEVSK